MAFQKLLPPFLAAPRAVYGAAAAREVWAATAARREMCAATAAPREMCAATSGGGGLVRLTGLVSSVILVTLTGL